jgi:hypothetical protein
VHFPDEHASAAPQRSSSQHGCPVPPHGEHVFFAVHTSFTAHRSPTARHVFALDIVVSQQPELQLSPGQQG